LENIMADGVFNISKGKVNEYMARVDGNDPANSVIVVVLCKVSEADGTLEDYDDLGALLAGSNTEADFTNYARKILADADVTAPAPDDTNNWQTADLPDQTWTSAGGATNNTLTKLIACYDPDSTGGADSALIPLTHHDFVATTDGNDLIAQFAAAGYYKAA
jgi:hypothetical protein